jgi:DegV family protein with EDD domain
VTTSGPAVGEFAAALEAADPRDGAVVVTVSHDMGASTFLSARAAADSVDVPVRVIDSTTAAGGEGLVVLAAARAAADGASLDGVESAARRVIERVRLVATLRDLEHLARSGHVPEAAAWAARWIGLRPVIELRNGRVRPMRPALGEVSALDRVLAAWRESRAPDAGPLHVAALHALDEEAATELLDRVRREIEPVEAFVGSFGTGMVVHSGPGVVGLAWWWDDPDG